jgi:uncharacterized protein YjiS (DUF1127 family)
VTVRSIALIRIAPSGSFRAMAREVWTRLGLMLRARHTRLMLGEMDDRLLADIGVGRGDASMEAARPMWDLEPPRRR